MVLLTMTPSLVEALQTLDAHPEAGDQHTDAGSHEPSLYQPAIGKPITHGQIIKVRDRLRLAGNEAHSLEALLRGATVFVPPPPPKPEPTDEYKALMARLRREEEERSYERMMQPTYSTRETFSQRFPNAPMGMADSFAAVNRPSKADDLGKEEFEFGDVQRQLTLIFNFVISIIGSGVAAFLLSKWWSTPARLGLAFGTSIVVGIADVVVYWIFNWRMVEGDKLKKKKDAVHEAPEILSTWVLGEDASTKSHPLSEQMLDTLGENLTQRDTDSHLRRRLKEADSSS